MANSKTLEVALYVFGILIIIWSVFDYCTHWEVIALEPEYLIRGIFGCCIVLIGRSIAIERTLKNK